MTPSVPEAADLLEVLTQRIRHEATAGSLQAMDALLQERELELARATTDAVSPEARDRLLRTLEAVRDLDAETEVTLRHRLAAMRSEFGHLEVGRRGLAGYASSPLAPGKRIDERG